MLCTFGRDAARELHQRFDQIGYWPAASPADTSLGCASAQSTVCATGSWPPRSGEVGMRPGYSGLGRAGNSFSLLLLKEFDGHASAPTGDVLSRPRAGGSGFTWWRQRPPAISTASATS